MTPPSGTSIVEASPASRPFVSPVARRIADDHGLEVDRIPGTGRGGRITKRDVLARVAQPPAAGGIADLATAPGGVAEPLSPSRRSPTTWMRRSEQMLATAHTAVQCDMSRVEKRRRELGIGPLAVVARATVQTLREFGALNAWLDDERLIHFDRVDLGLGITVSPGDADGAVPLIFDAQNLSEQGLATAIEDPATRARSRGLPADDGRGATFTICNFGASGAAFATPLVNLPEVGILDLGAITRCPVVITDDAGNESLAIRSVANLILGWDRRAIDGVYAAEFLAALRRRLER